MSDGWKYPPFELTVDPEGTGKLFGRGSSDDKGPILGWVNVIEAHVKQGLEMPVSGLVSRSAYLPCDGLMHARYLGEP